LSNLSTLKTGSHALLPGYIFIALLFYVIGSHVTNQSNHLDMHAYDTILFIFSSKFEDMHVDLNPVLKEMLIAVWQII
jgi:hypothetical protein